MSPEKTPVYIILGSAGSGRRELLADLIADGLAPGDQPAVLLSDAETPHSLDAKLPPGPRWTWQPGPPAAIELEKPPLTGPLFLVADGRRNPVDQMEAFKPWLENNHAAVARVICVVDCTLASHHPALLAWYDACVHFSDVVLLNRREGVENRWLSGFLEHFRTQHLPCVFETVKAGRVKNPALLLEPQARRLTQIFDEEQDWVVTDLEGGELEEGEETEDEEVLAAPAVDPYFARRFGGRRVKEIPDITDFLDQPGKNAAS
ncbi:MAG: hypothetical protein RJB55_1787 [Verrucomicrobiota bacterium]|jgi:hypothetical protein